MVREMENVVFGAEFRRALLLAHAASSIVLVGASTHHAIQMRHYLRGRFGRRPLVRTYAIVTSIAYVLTFALGALLYPSYRIFVRACFLEANAPAYARMFDVKEVFAALALLVAAGLGWIAHVWDPEREPDLAPVYAAMAILVTAVVWWSAISGILVTSVRGIG